MNEETESNTNNLEDRTTTDSNNEIISHQQNHQQPNLDIQDPFYFESDCAALRNNPDYSCLLKTLVLLEAQRSQACQDLERLLDVREQVATTSSQSFGQQQKSPNEFVRHLISNVCRDLPERQKVYCLPQIDWNKYYQIGGNNGGAGVDSDTLELIRQQNASASVNRSRRIQQQSKLNVKKNKLFFFSFVNFQPPLLPVKFVIYNKQTKSNDFCCYC